MNIKEFEALAEEFIRSMDGSYQATTKDDWYVSEQGACIFVLSEFKRFLEDKQLPARPNGEVAS